MRARSAPPQSGGRVVALVASTLILVAGAAPSALGPRYGGSIRVGVLDLQGAEQPEFVRGLGSRLRSGLLHETLIRLRDGSPAPSLAARWAAFSSGREWRIDVDPHASFHDGRPVTAADAVRSLRRFLKSASPAAAGLAQSLDGGVAFREGRTEELPGLGSSSAETLWLRFEAPASELPAALAAPAAAVTAADGTACGPFVLVHALREDRAAFVAFGRHVAGRPFLDEVEIRRYPDHDALRLAMAKGAVDVALGEPGAPDHSSRLLLLLDASRPAFRSAEHRRALAAAVDRRVLTQRFFPGSVPLCSLSRPAEVASGCGGPASASRVGDGIPVSLVVDAAVPATTSQRIVAHLLATGHDVTVKVLATDAASSAAGDARLLLWTPEVDTPTLDLAELARLASPPEPFLGAVLNALSRGPDGVAEAEGALLDSGAVIPLASASAFAVADPRVEGILVTPTGRLGLEDAWLAL